MHHQSQSLVLATLLCVSIGAATTAAPSGTDHWPVAIIDAMDDQRLVLFIRNDDIAASPQWFPAEDPAPPMSIAQALGQLRKWMVTDPRYQDAEVHEIELKPIHEHEREHRWYYLVQLRHRVDGKRKTLYAAVLFDAKVLPVLAEPDSLK